MTRRIVFRPQAEADIEEAADWYSERSPRLGLDFLRMVDRAVSSIAAYPLRYPKIRGKVRRAPLEKFPYRLTYEVTDDEVILLACRHVRRAPDDWRR